MKSSKDKEQIERLKRRLDRTIEELSDERSHAIRYHNTLVTRDKTIEGMSKCIKYLKTDQRDLRKWINKLLDEKTEVEKENEKLRELLKHIL